MLVTSLAEDTLRFVCWDVVVTSLAKDTLRFVCWDVVVTSLAEDTLRFVCWDVVVTSLAEDTLRFVCWDVVVTSLIDHQFINIRRLLDNSLQVRILFGLSRTLRCHSRAFFACLTLHQYCFRTPTSLLVYKKECGRFVSPFRNVSDEPPSSTSRRSAANRLFRRSTPHGKWRISASLVATASTTVTL